jgi:hypothetical protein
MWQRQSWAGLATSLKPWLTLKLIMTRQHSRNTNKYNRDSEGEIEESNKTVGEVEESNQKRNSDDKNGEVEESN